MADASTPTRSSPSIAALLLDHAPTGIALVEGEGFAFAYVNEAFQAISPERPMLGRPFAAVWPEVAEQVVGLLRRVRSSGTPVELADFRADVRRRLDGPLEEAWWNVTLKPLPGRPGEPASVAIHAVDRTAAVRLRREAERLQAEQERLREAQRAARGAEVVAEAIPQLVWTCGPTGETDWLNQRWRDYTGLVPGPVTGDPWRTVLHEHDAPRWLNRWMTAVRAGLPVDLEARLRAADGSFRWHLLRAVPLRDEAGRVVKWFGTATEIEEQRRIRDAAELARRREADARQRAEDASLAAGQRAAELDAVLDSIADGLVISNRESEFERANDTALRLLGELPPGSDWLQRFVARDDRGREVAAGQLPPARALRGEVVRGEELRLEPRAGRGAPTWLSVSAAPIRDERGAIRGVVTTFGDITRLRELQERQADLLRAISHDLRTPLTVILTQAQMLQRKPDDPATVVRRAESLRTSAQRMAAMIDDLVDLVRLEAGLVKLTPRAVPLASFAAELRDRLRGTLAVERLRLEVPEALPAASADPPRLERILVNLITNALKYSPPETETTLSGTLVDGQVQLTVADHGPGIPADEVDRVFERFYRSPSATRKEGLGLGLYITRLLVEAHGGHIRVESEVGRGSAFHVLLPRAAAGLGA
jgi:PAS domain S-box-containing protein